MRRIGAVAVVAVALTTSGCLSTGTEGGGRSKAEQSAISRATKSAEGLLASSPHPGYQDTPAATGTNGSGDAGKEFSGTVKGRGLLQVACAGTGEVTVTIPRQDVSKNVKCGDPASDFPFRKQVTGIIVGRVDSTGAYAWRILPAT